MLILKIILLLVGILALIASYNLPKNSEDPEDKKPENCYNFSGHLYLKKFLHISIFCFAVFYFMIDSKKSPSTKEDTQSVTEDKLIIPPNFFGKPLYQAPYFVCRENLIIQKDNKFTITFYSIGTLASADKAVIKGKLNDDGTINFIGSSEYQFSEDYKPTQLLSKWEMGTCCGDKKTINFFSKSFNTIKGEEEENAIMFGAEKCTAGY